MTRVGIVVHRDRPDAHALACKATAWLRDHGVEVRIPEADAEAAGLPEHAVPIDAFAPGLDLAISLGGDGTMLHTVALAYEAGVPVVGVNAGHLGYLTALEPADLLEALPGLVAGAFEVVERMVLRLDVASGGKAAGTYHALNEAAVEKANAGHLVWLDVAINGAPFTRYAADGVIVATPTGSTAYAMSAHGPIVSPSHRCLVLTPVAAHMLFDRSLVLGPDETVGFEVTGDRPVVCTVDGRELGLLEPGDRLTVVAAERPARIVGAAHRDFHQLLKAKFRLTDR